MMGGDANKRYLDSSSQEKRVVVSSWRSCGAWLHSDLCQGRTANVSAASSSERSERSRR